MPARSSRNYKINLDITAAARSYFLELPSRRPGFRRIAAVFAVLALLCPARPMVAAQDSAAGTAAFKTHCAACHAADGSGNTTVGKSMNIPDLHSAEIQKLSDAEIATVISNGKNGMPPFKNLSKDQIHSLIAHLRELAAKK